LRRRLFSLVAGEAALLGLALEHLDLASAPPKLYVVTINEAPGGSFATPVIEADQVDRPDL
jgi:hypothetical protein